MTKQPPMLMESVLTKHVYIVTSYKDNGDGTFTARQKYDVTEQFDTLVKTRMDNSASEQILAAMLERGTCYDVWQDNSFANFKCSKCGKQLHYRDKKRIACCPFCKREVVKR